MGVPRLRLELPLQQGVGLIPGQAMRIPHDAAHCSQKEHGTVPGTSPHRYFANPMPTSKRINTLWIIWWEKETDWVWSIHVARGPASASRNLRCLTQRSPTAMPFFPISSAEPLIGRLHSRAWQRLVATPSGDLEILQLVSTSNFLQSTFKLSPLICRWLETF